MRVLRLSNVDRTTALEKIVYSITMHIPEIEDYFLSEVGDPGPDTLDDYDVVWCYTGGDLNGYQFTETNYPDLFAKLHAYEGRTVNWRCSQNLNHEVMTQMWIDAGIESPDFIKFPERHLPQWDEIPSGWEFPLMIKACREYPRVTYAEIIENDAQYAQWIKDHGEYEHVLQRYYPFQSPDGFYYGAQLSFVGDEFLPRSARWTDHWYVSPTYRGNPHLGLEVGGFSCLPGFTSYEDIFAQAYKIKEVAKVDVGNIDFSLTENGLMIPWGICTVFSFFYTEGSDARQVGRENMPSAVGQVWPQTRYWNRLLADLGIDRTISDNMMWRALVGSRLNL